MGLWKGYTEILKGLLSVHDSIRDDFSGIADNLRKRSPQFRMFFDSEIGSATETVTKKFWADSIISGIRTHLPKGRLTDKLANGLGSWIGEKANSCMDRVKLMDHYRKGRITVDDYMRERSIQIQGTLINITQKAKKFLWIGRQAVYKGLEAMGIPSPDSILGRVTETMGARWVVKKIHSGVDKLVKSEKARQLCERGVVEFHAGVTAVKQAYKTVKEAVIDPVIQKTASFVDKAAEKVVDFGKKTFSAVKTGVKTVLKWVKSLV